MTEQEQARIFCANLKKYMSLGNYTQREVAAAIGVNPQTFNTWMKGYHIPRMDKIQKLADFFGVKKSELVDVHDEREETVEEVFARRVDLRELVFSARDLSTDQVRLLIEMARVLK